MYKQVYDEIGATVTAYKNSKHELHRLDGPALETSRGLKEWYVDGKLHRLDGPAVIQPNRYKAWYLDDKLHCVCGPAIEHADGSTEWSIYSKYVSYPERDTKQMQGLNNLLKLTLLQNKSRKFNEWLFDPDHYAGKWHKKNMLRDFQDS